MVPGIMKVSACNEFDPPYPYKQTQGCWGHSKNNSTRWRRKLGFARWARWAPSAQVSFLAVASQPGPPAHVWETSGVFNGGQEQLVEFAQSTCWSTSWKASRLVHAFNMLAYVGAHWISTCHYLMQVVLPEINSSLGGVLWLLLHTYYVQI